MYNIITELLEREREREIKKNFKSEYFSIIFQYASTTKK